jgi:uncharacterized CHY-type Zn-finger protein
MDELPDKENESTQVGVEHIASFADAYLHASLYVECPKCSTDFNLFDCGDGLYTTPIFNNKWEDLEGEEVCCPDCEHEFKISEIIW